MTSVRGDSIGAYLREILARNKRRGSGIRTQLALAKALDKDVSYINKLVIGKIARPEIETLDAIAGVLAGADIKEMMRVSGYPESARAALEVAEAPAPVQLPLSDPDEAFDPEAIVAYVESRPGDRFREQMRTLRESMSYPDYVRFCVGIFRAWASNANLAVTTARLLDQRSR